MELAASPAVDIAHTHDRQSSRVMSDNVLVSADFND
jgi:hypothetical protein